MRRICAGQSRKKSTARRIHWRQDAGSFERCSRQDEPKKKWKLHHRHTGSKQVGGGREDKVNTRGVILYSGTNDDYPRNGLAIMRIIQICNKDLWRMDTSKWPHNHRTILVEQVNKCIYQQTRQTNKKRGEYLKYKKRLLLRCIHHFKSDLINNMDHMCISGNEPFYWTTPIYNVHQYCLTWVTWMDCWWMDCCCCFTSRHAA